MKKDRCSILIVDDDEADRALYRKFLENCRAGESYIFKEAKTGEEGLALYKEAPPDCVLLDYNLPDMNGLNFLWEMAKISPILPVVMLTGQGSEEIAADTIKSGAQDYMAKHVVTGESLRRAIINTMERATLLRKVALQTEELRVSRDRAEQADKAKSEFLATMSHEIRTPMNGIIGMAELLSYSNLNEKQNKYVGSIKSSGALLLTIINDILDFSKIEAQEMHLESKPLELDELLTEVMQLLSSRAQENRVELILRWPHDRVMPGIMADPMRLRQIMINIVGNAIKFTKDGHVLINVVHHEPKDGLVDLRFEVVDTGIGIPADKIDKIFGQFTQVDSSTTREYGGTGLGLTICKRLVEMMGGRIGVESVLGKGSTFWFELSLPVAVEEDIVLHSDYRGDLTGKRILIVDDHPLNLRLFSEYLLSTGIKVETAAMASAALDKLQAAQEAGAPYDVVLTDYAMPKMDGETFSQKIGDNPEKYGTPKRILVTGLGRKKSFETLARSGFCAHLFKPVFPAQLVECVAGVLGGADMERNQEDTPADFMGEVLPQLGVRVLVVEDDRVSQRMAKSVLGELGCSCDVAGDGREALAVLERKHSEYDIVFMDWQMPVMDGHAAIRKIRQQDWGRGLKIIALTANAIQGDREKCLQAGADDYMSKPVHIAEVIRILQKYTGSAAESSRAA